MKNKLQVSDLFKENKKMFIDSFGEEVSNINGLEFNNPPGFIDKVLINKKKRRFMLGGIYSTKITAYTTNTIYPEFKSPIKVKYKGILTRQGVNFHHSDTQINENIVSKLNSNKKLLNTLNMLDLESINIWIRENIYEIEIIPLNGSYMFITIPPIRYNSNLRREDISKISDVIFRISETLNG